MTHITTHITDMRGDLQAESSGRLFKSSLAGCRNIQAAQLVNISKFGKMITLKRKSVLPISYVVNPDKSSKSMHHCTCITILICKQKSTNNSTGRNP